MFYGDDMHTGCGWVMVAGMAADLAAGCMAGTTGAIIEGVTDVRIMVTAAGWMMAPAGIASPGTMSTTSYGSVMLHCTAIASHRAWISD